MLTNIEVPQLGDKVIFVGCGYKQVFPDIGWKEAYNTTKEFAAFIIKIHYLQPLSSEYNLLLDLLILDADSRKTVMQSVPYSSKDKPGSWHYQRILKPYTCIVEED